MNKHELIEALKDENGLSKTEARTVVDMFFDAMSDALADGSRVEIRGLGAFEIRHYGSRSGPVDPI